MYLPWFRFLWCLYVMGIEYDAIALVYSVSILCRHSCLPSLNCLVRSCRVSRPKNSGSRVMSRTSVTSSTRGMIHATWCQEGDFISARPTLDSREANLSVLPPKTSKNLKHKSMSSDTLICITQQLYSLVTGFAKSRMAFASSFSLQLTMYLDHSRCTSWVRLIWQSINLIAHRSIDITRIVNWTAYFSLTTKTPYDLWGIPLLMESLC